MRKERISIVFIFYIGNICCFLRTHYSHILIIISDTFILQLDGVFVLTHYGITFFIMLMFYTTLSLISSIEFLFIPIEFDSARTIESIDRSLAPTFVYMQYFPIFWAYINDSVVYFFFFYYRWAPIERMTHIFFQFEYMERITVQQQNGTGNSKGWYRIRDKHCNSIRCGNFIFTQ